MEVETGWDLTTSDRVWLGQLYYLQFFLFSDIVIRNKTGYFQV